jgi:hypothetical protein
MKPKFAALARPVHLIGVMAFLVLPVGGDIARAAAGLPLVTSASVDLTAGGYGQLTVTGQFLLTPPIVTLGGTALGVVSASTTRIVASLQNVAGIQDEPGDYLLTLSKGSLTYASSWSRSEARGRQDRRARRAPRATREAPVPRALRDGPARKGNLDRRETRARQVLRAFWPAVPGTPTPSTPRTTS